MVTQYEKKLQRAAVAKRIREHAAALHALAVRVPFWHVDDAGPELVMRDTDGHLLITFHGEWAQDMAKWVNLLGRTPAMALADLVRDSAGIAEFDPGREAALKLLQEMRLEPKPERYRRR